jgi:SAM-dependent methyltransferase
VIAVDTKLAYRDQFVFQREHCFGHALNVGANTDGGNLKRDFGAVNLDLRAVDHVTGDILPVDVLGDARDLPYRGEFDTVILGEILEHMERRDAVCSLRQAALALRAGGQVVITMPHDVRRDAGTLPVPEGEAQFYAPGIYAYHYRSISRRELVSWLVEAGLTIVRLVRILYVWGQEGSGVVAVAAGDTAAISRWGQGAC